MGRRFRTNEIWAMLLFTAASLVLCTYGARADNGDTEASGNTVTAMLHASVDDKAEAEATSLPDAISLDSNGSGTVTAADAALYMRYITGCISALPSAANGVGLTLEDCESALDRLVESRFVPDLSALDAYMRGRQVRQYRTYAEDADVFMEAAEAVHTLAMHVLGDCMAAASRDLRALSIPLHDSMGVENAPNWKGLAALYCVYGERTADVLRASFSVDLADVEGGAKTLTAAFRGFDETSAFGGRDALMQCKLAYAYFNTVYDMQGVAVLTEKSRYTGDYIDTLVNPLPGCLIKNCWFDPRDKGTRLHVGADIQAAARTHILSVTDGVVLYIGYLPVPGNYVVIRDPFGYEYHYYHMFEQSKLVAEGDTVKHGDAIGRVGNTGNSASNHLHLSIVSPEYRYVNPYDLFLQAGFEPIRIDS